MGAADIIAEEKAKARLVIGVLATLHEMIVCLIIA
jgi:hypothetical protein